MVVVLLGASSVSASEVPFAAEQPLNTSFAGASSVTTVDLDADGDLDVVGAASSDGDVVWWENGNAWAEHTIDDMVPQANSVAVADVDGDGDPDIIASDGDDLMWWANDGSGGGWPKTSIDYSNGEARVAAADLDGDGDPDLLAATAALDGIGWWENGNAWTKHHVTTTFSGAIDATAADLDGDGDLDVVGAARTANDIVWWANDGNGGGWAATYVDTAFADANSVAVADLDGDGDLDILGTSPVSGVAWWENGSAWSEHTVDGGFTNASRARVADVDGDGDLDVLGTAAGSSDELAWWENDGSGGGWTKHTLGFSFGNAEDVAAADLDGDGDLDMLGAAASDNTISWWQNENIHRRAIFPQPESKHVVDGNLYGVSCVNTGDLDGDGDLDILASGPDDGILVWYENGSTPANWLEHTVDDNITTLWEQNELADLDGDGDLDALAVYSNAVSSYQDISWWENDGTGGGWTEHVLIQTFSGAVGITAADLDGDGDQDVIAAASYTTDRIDWWENDGGVWTRRTVVSGFDGACNVVVADIDDDGDHDVVGVAKTAGMVSWWANDGSAGGWLETTVASGLQESYSIAVADIDHDGDLDIAGTEYTGNTLTWWANDGTGGTWAPTLIDDDFSNGYTIVLADLDDDGDQDVAAAADDDQLVWWNNSAGDGSTWVKQLVDFSANGRYKTVAVADIDRDGNLDLVSGLYNPDDVDWWEDLGGQLGLATTVTAPAYLVDAQIAALLQVVATHNGRAGDNDAELTAIELRFEETAGDPLTSSEANAIIENLNVYRDDGSGDFELGTDALVATVADLSLVDGNQSVSLADGDIDARIQLGNPAGFFVVVEVSAGASGQTAIDRFEVTHLAGLGSAEDRDHDTSLTLEHAADTSTGEIAISRARVWDGGGTSQNWSEGLNWVGGTAPLAYDSLYFDSGAGDTVLDAGFTGPVADVVITSAYGGQITQANGLHVAGDWNQDGGTFVGSDSTLRIDGAFDLSGGLFTAPSGLMRVGGGFAHTGGIFDPNRGRVLLDHAADQALVAPQLHDLVINDGLVGYWKLDEASGAIAGDSSGFGNHGIVANATALTWNASVPASLVFSNRGSLLLDGDDEYVRVDGVAAHVGRHVSISLWLRANSELYEDETLFGVNTVGGGNVLIGAIASDETFWIYDGGSGTWEGDSGTNVVSDSWRHLAYTSNGVTGRLYVDGSEKASHVVDFSFSGDDLWSLGQEWDGGSPSSFLNGRLDDVRIYDRVLSPAEIEALADGEHPDTGIATTTLGMPLDLEGDLVLNSGILDPSAGNCAGACTITVAGDLVRSGGTFTHNDGMVTFDGSERQNLDIDPYGIRLFDLHIDRTATLVVHNEFTANGAMTNDGTLQQTKDVSVGVGTGFLTMGDYGGLHVSNYSAQSSDMGPTTVTIRGNRDCSADPTAVRRCYDIAPTETEDLDVTFQFHFAESELAGNECDALEIYHHDGSAWQLAGILDTSWGEDGRVCPGEPYATEPYSVRVNSVSQFSPFVLSSGVPGLPVLVFEDGFESGDWSAWSQARTHREDS